MSKQDWLRWGPWIVLVALLTIKCNANTLNEIVVWTAVLISLMIAIAAAEIAEAIRQKPPVTFTINDGKFYCKKGPGCEDQR